MRVQSDSSAVRDLVEVIATTVRDHGGYVHPDLVVHHEGANLWLALPRSANPYVTDDQGLPLARPHAQADPLLIVPDALHIPVTDLDWEPHDRVLRYRASAEHLSQAQRTILDAMVALFNAVDKVSVIGQTYAVHALSDDPELLAKLEQARPHFLPGAAYGPMPGESNPARTVVSSRLRGSGGPDDDGPAGYFMPMIDMLNHHPYGSRYRRTDNGDWRIDVHHPGPTDEVYVRYNKADALGVALGLGYAETATRFVSSVHCRVHVEALGEVEVQGVATSRRRVPAPRLTRTDTGWALLGLELEAGRLDALRTLLAMPVRSLSRTTDSAAALRVADDLLAAVVASNIAYYEQLLALCTAPSGAGADSHQRALFAAVSRHQLDLLHQLRRAISR